MTAQAILDRVRSSPARLGTSRLLCIDGPAGSGKSTLAAKVADLSAAPVVRMDDLYPGWSGLLTVASEVIKLLEPLSRDMAGRYRRYDWIREEYAEEHLIAPAPLIVLEGVGSGDRAWSDWISTLIWVETDDETRLQRGLARDGDQFHAQWLGWMADEERLFAREGTQSRADLVLRT